MTDTGKNRQFFIFTGNRVENLVLEIGRHTFSLPHLKGNSMFAALFPAWSKQIQPKRPFTRLGVEILEDRRVPALFTVGTVNDTPDANLGDGLAQDAAGNTSLRAAIQEGNVSADAEITIKFNLPANSVIILGSALPTLNNNLANPATNKKTFNLDGPSAAQLTVRGGGAVGGFRNFSVNTNVVANFNAFSITEGAATGIGLQGSGGGIINNGTLNLYQIHMHHNQAQFGGAIYNNGTLTVENSSLYLNTALINGGAIHNAPNRQAWIQFETQVTSNSAPNGGGIYNLQGTLTVDGGSKVNSNTATTGNGGGVYNDDGTVTFADAFLDSNTAGAKGGGIYCDRGTVNFTATSIQSNNAPDANNGKGGGIYVRRGTVTLVSGCTLAGNTAGAAGVGACWHPDGTLNANPLQNTITDNTIVDPNP
jgi:predicted outer membrane repeat protein